MYFPARDHLHFLTQDGKSYLATSASKDRNKNAKLLKAKVANNKVVYKNNRIPAGVIRLLEEKKYKVYDDTHEDIGAADTLLAVMEGKFLAYLSHTRQIRDILLGPILAGAGGYAVDWNGKPVIWPSGGRIPRVLFGVGKYPQEIISCLRNS